MKARLSRSWLPALAALALAACSGGNNQSSFSPDSAVAHPAANWLPTGHATAANADLSSCATCHGSDFSGGISQVACTQCHMGDPLNVHPLDWGSQTYATHGPYVTANGIAACTNANCHGTSLLGITSSGPSCSSCHIGGPMQVHPYPIAQWGTNVTDPGFHGTYVTSKGTASCANAVCHGANLQGVTNSGSSCLACHSQTFVSAALLAPAK
jgi:hypothetical protein